MDNKIAVTLATLESARHEVNAIKQGLKIYNAGNTEFEARGNGEYFVAAEDKSGRRGGAVVFTKDGCGIESFVCNCRVSNFGKTLCKHIVAGIFAIQGGVVETNLSLGKKATAETTVMESNTAWAVGSGRLEVFAIPMMIALMEQAACNALLDALEPGQTSVGTSVNIEHTAATPLGLKITALATIESVNGRNITFAVSASDECGEIGSGTHTRVIVDEEKFMSKANGKIRSDKC